ncbi:putative methyltransferase At1g78140 chloroplastic [Bienertia sinuspersici]
MSEPATTTKIDDSNESILGCPISYEPLTWSGDSRLSMYLFGSSSKKTYYENDSIFDLTASSGAKDYVESKPLVTEFFSTPFMSFLYERGWRQNFGLGGYPGPDKEYKMVKEYFTILFYLQFEMAKEYFKPVLGGNIVDASCGSGLFSRLLLGVECSLLLLLLTTQKQCCGNAMNLLKRTQASPKSRMKLILVRADISRLPFVSGSIDAVHAGAALHCWPSPSSAVAEISRILRPGGVFVATTTIADGPFTLVPFRRNFREYLQQFSGSRVFLSERELEDLCTTCGLVDFRCTRIGLFVMISASKPS